MDSDQRATVEIMKDSHGLDQVLLREPRGASARVHLFGGQVTSWKNERQEELLFMSSKALFKPPKAIRGGIPICFPQFGNSGSLEQHGFARNKLWAIDNNPPPLPANDYHNKAVVDLILKSNDDDLKSWPYCFQFRLRVALAPGGDLTLISRIRNIDNNEVRIEGLETLDYLDNLQNKERFTEQSDAITFESEMDRVYLSTPTKVAILDHEKKRTFVLRKDGLPDAVVWNPWEKKAKAIVDFGDDEYKHMLCVDGAAIEKPITLRSGEEWKGRIELSTVPSSYCSGQLDPRRVLEG